MIIYLEPKSTFPNLHSDTIFGALCNVLSEFYPNFIGELKEDFKDQPAFILSSAFPYVSLNDKKKHFLPKIDVFKKDDNSSNNMDNYKKYKKLQYFDEDIFMQLIKNQISSNEIINNLSEYNIQSKILTKEKTDDIKIKQVIKPNNIIHRINNSSLNVFYTEGYQYHNIGLYFIVQIFNEKYEKIIKTGLKLLQDRGFGANISTGQGQFTFTVDENSEFEEKLLNNEGKYYLTLSRYIPTKDELSKVNEHSSYTINSKRGINSNGELKKKIRFFEEGSIFPSYQEYYGKIMDVGTITPAIEYGYAFPIKLEVEQ